MKKKIKLYLRIIFSAFQKLGLNIIPNHYYSNIPDFTFLDNEDFWKAPQSMVGVNGSDRESQLEFTRECINHLPDKSVLNNLSIISKAEEQQKEIGGYGPIEADFLYAFICRYKPAKVIQVGCGVSTAVILNASKDVGHEISIICVEAYPSDYLKRMDESGEIKLIWEMAQKTDLETLTDLEAGDLLFVDSTHTVKAGSEVNRLILEVLPRLKKGVFVHFHDIYFPFDYQRGIKETVLFWNESTLLHAFLIGNRDFTIKVSQSMLHYSSKDELKVVFPNYRPQSENQGIALNKSRSYHFPASTYLQTI